PIWRLGVPMTKYYVVRTPHPSLPNRATHIRHDTVLKQLDVAVGRGWDVDITRSDLEYMAARPYPTFAHWVTMFVGAILMADEDDLGSIVSGRHIGGHYIRSGQRFDPSADHDQRHQAVFRAVGLDLVSTVAGLTEVATMLVATHHPMFDLSSSCLLSTTPGAVCGRCDKCFRKELIRAWVEARPPDSRILQWGENDPTTRRRFERYETTQQPHAFAFLACRIEGLEDSFLSRWVQQFDDPFSATEWVPKSYPRAIAEWVPARWREQVTANVARYLATMGPDDIRVVETWPEPLRHQTEEGAPGGSGLARSPGYQPPPVATNPDIERSVVMPWLNEADTLRTCIRKAIRAMHEAGIVGEVIVADNGSTDGAQEIARSEGARVVDIPVRGYGSALIGGIAEARGKFILMGDADDSYDFTEIPRFVAALREGAELVQGCRLPKGGGTVLPGAMPFLHRWWGNPMFTAMARRWFGAPINDINCGMRAFSRDLYDRLELRSLGMEFANEMIIKASLMGARISEVPITLHPDGRKSHGPHLRTFRDGWRTLRFYLIFSPTWLFL